MRLSVCCLTGDDPAVVEAVLAPVRELADEIVIGVDDRVPDPTLVGYERLSDRLVPFTFKTLEAHLGDLHAACRGTWVLRLDTDEVVSPALVAALPSMLDDTTSAWAIPRRWLYGDAAHWIDEVPWWPDFQLRLVRMPTGPEFGGLLHEGMAVDGPVRYHDAPLYHLDFLLNDQAARARKAVVYECDRAGYAGVGGRPLHTYYEPERHAELAPAVVPPEDRAAIAPLAAAHDLAAPPETSALPSAQSPTATLGSVSLQPIERDLRAHAREARAIAMRLSNHSPAPLLATGARATIVRSEWLRPDGSCTHNMDSPLPVDVAPGSNEIVPVGIHVPETPDDSTLQLEVIVAGTPSGAAPARLDATITEPLTLPEHREWRPDLSRRDGPVWRLARTLRHGRHAAHRTTIPRVIHRVWLGDRAMPEAFREYGETWRRLNPGWEMRLWTDDDVPDPPAAQQARNISERVDVIQYEILRRQGGIYIDTDMECVKPLDELLTGVRAFAAYEVPGRLGTAIMGTVAGHPAFEEAMAIVGRTCGTAHFPESTGPVFFTRTVERFADLTLFSADRFYPYRWDEAPSRGDPQRTYAIHHWANTWATDDRAAR